MARARRLDLIAPADMPPFYEGSGDWCWPSCGGRAFRVVTILRLSNDSSHSCPLSSRVVLADLTSPAAATAIATLAAVTSSAASYTLVFPSYAAAASLVTVPWMFFGELS